ncbi:Do family serine endopeptidase [Oricola cellulosilytica]|uniref:Probable periplasmic serine endoprotease DegP-like n=1 Tax=Oricola cellulosilytica TaxID=1429082 RepID=A0A4R0PCE6_9HYPH|nr:Do family serine endopeptidase [Oricola cellulosilytica]TCD14138.1 Do family serine endopeptidase [Oricola cellulosilytica]
MTTTPKSPRKSVQTKIAAALLATTVLGAGVAGFSGTSMTPATAEAVRVETPAAAPGFADIIEKVSPAVVSVRVKSDIQPASSDDFGFGGRNFDDLPDGHPLKKFFREFGPQFRDGPRAERHQQRPRRPRPTSQGSGFFISEDGFLVTNNHVIEGGSEFTVVMDDGTELDAELIGSDPRTDLAVLKVEEAREFVYVDFADDANTRVGDWVVAVGNPFGLGGTVTAGIVSARGRDIGAGPYDDFIQIDAAVNRGNSGGPTFNLSGEVVGVNTAIFSPSGGNVGIAFAVPSSTARSVVADLMNDGSVERGWLGIRIQAVTDEIADALGLDGTNGVLVADPQADAPAAKAGIRAGDIITAVNGDAVKDPRGLSRRIAAFDPGTEVEITLLRRGKEQTINVKLGELPGPTVAAADAAPEAAPETALSDFGLTIAPAEDGDGVVVTAVEPDSPAEEAGVRAGEVIREVNNKPVKSASDIEEALDEVAKSGRKAALMLLERDDTSRFAAIPLNRG